MRNPELLSLHQAASRGDDKYADSCISLCAMLCLLLGARGTVPTALQLLVMPCNRSLCSFLLRARETMWAWILRDHFQTVTPWAGLLMRQLRIHHVW